MDHKFELLLKSNRNWLSKYGGMISVLIIILLIYGILQIRIPQYARVEISETNVLTLPNKALASVTEGDIIYVQNIAGTETAITVVTIDETTKKTHIRYTADEQLLADEKYKIIVAQNSLFKSVTSSLFK